MSHARIQVTSGARTAYRMTSPSFASGSIGYFSALQVIRVATIACATAYTKYSKNMSLSVFQTNEHLAVFVHDLVKHFCAHID